MQWALQKPSSQGGPLLHFHHAPHHANQPCRNRHIFPSSLTSKQRVSALDLLLLIPSLGPFLCFTSDLPFAVPNISEVMTAFICVSPSFQRKENKKLKVKPSWNLSVSAGIASKSWISILNSTTHSLETRPKLTINIQWLPSEPLLTICNELPKQRSLTKLYDLIMKVLPRSEVWNPSAEDGIKNIYI